eukprot:TRINITY_DN26310_c0_g1_i1.p1 TRINITY_DN26310_c0_g1~~TRINITY_DN26310_c0_g1_i1.p1  ORF type:complete len:283 (+),score=71.02 TRINITY_DN26310_c0_g1_i1:82-930(+)
MQLPRRIIALFALLVLPARTSKLDLNVKKKVPQSNHMLNLRQAMGTAYDVLDKDIVALYKDTPDNVQTHVTHDKMNKGSDSVHQQNSQARRKSDAAMPVSAQMSKNELNNFLNHLSRSCRVQFENMLEGKGDAKNLHRFGTSEKHMDEDGCKRIGGAICSNHAQVKTTFDAPDGRRLTSKSDVDGDSCLPKSCIKDPDLKMLASFVQHHAVESLGASSQGQEAPEVLLDVDCTQSGGSSYSASGSWDMEAGGAGKMEHSLAARQWAQTSFLLAVVMLVAAWL